MKRQEMSEGIDSSTWQRVQQTAERNQTLTASGTYWGILAARHLILKSQ